MICRLWRGWTSKDKESAYLDVVQGQVIPAIEARGIEGFEQIDLLRRDLGDETEFVTLMCFADMEAVGRFAGDEPERSHVPPAARAVLARFDERAAHFEVVDRRPQGRRD